MNRNDDDDGDGDGDVRNLDENAGKTLICLCCHV